MLCAKGNALLYRVKNHSDIQETEPMTGTCTIVIPTYNEERNIANIARAIREAYPDYRRSRP